jgi:hypothetical protein
MVYVTPSKKCALFFLSAPPLPAGKTYSVEPEGSHPQPTGPIALQGQL